MPNAFRLLVLSDTHGNVPLAVRAAEIVSTVDEIIHLGDHFDDALILEDILGRPLIKIPGNCDYEPRISRELTLTFAGITFFITHGDRYGVKSGLDRIRRRGIETGSSAIIFGHTHTPLIDQEGDILLINPGCLIKDHPPTAALITINAGTATARIIPVPSD